MTAGIGKGKVGRPPKLKPKVILPNAGYPLHMKIEQLRNAIKNVAIVSKLSPAKVDELVSGLTHAMGNFPAAEALRKITPARSQGNRNKMHEQVLLYDCARAWAKVSGNPPAIWQKDGDSNAGGSFESVSVTLAKAVLNVITGKQLTSSMRRQASKARLIKQG